MFTVWSHASHLFQCNGSDHALRSCCDRVAESRRGRHAGLGQREGFIGHQCVRTLNEVVGRRAGIGGCPDDATPAPSHIAPGGANKEGRRAAACISHHRNRAPPGRPVFRLLHYSKGFESQRLTPRPGPPGRNNFRRTHSPRLRRHGKKKKRTRNARQHGKPFGPGLLACTRARAAGNETRRNRDDHLAKSTNTEWCGELSAKDT